MLVLKKKPVGLIVDRLRFIEVLSGDDIKKWNNYKTHIMNIKLWIQCYLVNRQEIIRRLRDLNYPKMNTTFSLERR